MRNNQTYNDSEFPQQLFTRALGTSDFKDLLSDVNTTLLTNGWVNCPVSYPEFTKSVEVPNFKENSLLSISSFSKLSKVEEHQEISNGGFATDSESFKLETFAKIFTVSEIAYINDKLDVIKSAPILMGASARQTVEETVYTVLLNNPVLSDGIQLCHADHGNLINRCPQHFQSGLSKVGIR